MALVIEAGQAGANSQSYASAQDLKDYAKLRGASIPSNTTELEVLLIKAMERLEAVPNFVGERLTKDQALQWPRAWAEIECWAIATNEIPRQLVQAQCALAIEAAAGTDLMPTVKADASGPVLERTVDVITTVYVNPGNVSRTPTVTKADALLRVLVRRSAFFATRA
jgi:hypothetical protein